MSKLAALCKNWGYYVSGSDAADSKLIADLRDIGIDAYIGINESIAAAADLVVYSSAIKPNHAELIVSRRAIERKEMLGYIERRFSTSIAVSGAHGKTTMSGMLAWTLKELGYSLHSHVGGEVIGLDSLGMNDYYNLEGVLSDDKIMRGISHDMRKGDTLVIEACEYKRSFLTLQPDYSVILNIDYDHPDCYDSVEDTYSAFAEFIANTRRECYIENTYADKLSALARAKLKDGDELVPIITFGNDPSADYYTMYESSTKDGCTADVYKRGKYHGRLNLKLSNIINIKAGIAVVAILDNMGIPIEDILLALSLFKGISRRFEYLGKSAIGSDVYTDYAHHPEEITAMLNCLNKLTINGRKILIFQPHTYSRTKALLSQFVNSLRGAEICYILPTYPAREHPSHGMTAYELYDMLRASGYNNAHYCCNYEELMISLNYIDSNDALMLCGAGIEYKEIFQLMKNCKDTIK